MAKWIKIVLALVVVLPVTAAVALATLVEPNDYKPELEALVTENTGREFSIDGDIELSFFPWLGFQVQGLNLANHAEFSSQPMFQMQSASARLKLLPLLLGKLQIAVIEINGMQATVGMQKNGEPSWADMVTTEDADAETSAAEDGSETAETKLPDFSLTRLSINGAALRWLDKSANSETVIAPINLEIGQAKAGQAFPLNADLRLRQTADGVETAVDMDLQTKVLLDADNGLIAMSSTVLALDAEVPGLKPLDGEIKMDLEALLDGSRADLKNLSGQINGLDLSGQLSASRLTAKPLINAVLALGELNVDDFVVAETSEASSSAETQASDAETEAARAQLNATPVDVSALKTLDAKLKLSAKALKASGLTATNAEMVADISNGVLTLSKLSTDLYQGNLNASAKVDANAKPARFQWQHQLQNVEAALLQEDMMEKAYISGSANMDSRLTMAGDTVGALRQSLAGQGNLAFVDGALKGINVAGTLRKAFAKFKKQPLPENETEVLDTDFSSATASFTISNGILNNPDMLVESPLIRITGEGDINLVNETLNYRAKPVVVASLEGQGGRSLDELDGLPIPVKCSGALAAPDCSTDFSGLLKDQAKAALEKEKAAAKAKLEAEKQAAKEKLEQEKQEAEAKAREKLEDKAKDLLNKWR
jgi:AsmA protein